MCSFMNKALCYVCLLELHCTLQAAPHLLAVGSSIWHLLRTINLCSWSFLLRWNRCSQPSPQMCPATWTTRIWSISLHMGRRRIRSNSKPPYCQAPLPGVWLRPLILAAPPSAVSTASCNSQFRMDNVLTCETSLPLAFAVTFTWWSDECNITRSRPVVQSAHFHNKSSQRFLMSRNSDCVCAFLLTRQPDLVSRSRP